MKQSNFLCSVALVALSCLAPPLHAQLTYVDADDDFIMNGNQNLFPAAGGTIDTVLDQVGFSDTDDIWGFREFAASGTIFAARESEDAPELVQTIPGLTSGNSYDVYATYWSSTSADWGIRAGFSSNPGANQYFNRTGGTVSSAIAGNAAVSASWSVPPADNPTASNDTLGVYAEGNRFMLLGKIGTAMADGSGELDVYIDDLAPSEYTGSGDRRSWLDGLAYAPVGVTPYLEATVDRTTGEVAISNGTGSTYDLRGYSVTSALGVIDTAEWTSIASGSNPDVSDDAGDWMEDIDTAFEISESEISTPTSVGATLGAAGLSFGNAWVASPFEDIQLQVTIGDATNTDTGLATFSIPVEFVNGAQLLLGDFNGDTTIDLADYGVLLTSLHADISPTSALEAHSLGDMNGDSTVEYSDLSAFAAAYDDANGFGSFQSAIIAVPEPSTVILFALAFLFIAGRSRFKEV